MPTNDEILAQAQALQATLEATAKELEEFAQALKAGADQVRQLNNSAGKPGKTRERGDG